MLLREFHNDLHQFYSPYSFVGDDFNLSNSRVIIQSAKPFIIIFMSPTTVAFIKELQLKHRSFDTHSAYLYFHLITASNVNVELLVFYCVYCILQKKLKKLYKAVCNLLQVKVPSCFNILLSYLT